MGNPKIGDPAPEFTLTDDQGERVSLAQFRGRTVVLYFYPKDDTPGCTQEACDFRDQLQDFSDLDAVILGVSKDPQTSHARFKTKYHLPFTLLSDPDLGVLKAYGVWKNKQFMGKTFLGVERTTFVIGPGGRIAKIFPKVKVKGHVAEVLEGLRAERSRT